MTPNARALGAGLLVAALAALPRPSAAEDGLASGPWHEGVGPEDQQAAMALFEEGVTLQKRWLLAEAVARYEQALTHWEHPQIRFYLGRVQEKMGDLIPAYDNLRRALRWGPAAFPDQAAALAREMRERLEAQLAWVSVRCAEPGARVFLDGKLWFVGPGQRDAVVLPGEHAVIARKDGYFTVSESISLVPGKRASAEVRLRPEVVIRRRWEGWGPRKTWAMVGAGGALALAGGVLLWQADRDYDAYDQRFAAICGDAPLCTPHASHPDMPAVLRRARWENGLAIGAFVAAGAALATGAALGLLDRPRPHRNRSTGRVEVELAPMVAPAGAGAALGGSF